MLDKFIGDAIMAVFGLPVPHDDDADRAVRAADRDDHASCCEWNAQRAAEGRPPVDMGIGLNTDTVVVGQHRQPEAHGLHDDRRRREPRVAPRERVQAVRRPHPGQRAHLQRS